MIIRGASNADLAQAAELVGVVLSNVRPSGKGIGPTLGLRDDRKWQRYSAGSWPGSPRRKVHAVCWHGYYAFMDELTKTRPEVVIQSSTATYRGRTEFVANANDTGDRNIGSAMNPTAYREACKCEEIPA